MKRIADWLNRLCGASPEDLRENYFRIIVPGSDPFEMREHIIALQPLGQVSYRFGDMSPVSGILLRYLDTAETSNNLTNTQGVATELGALISLASGRRFEVATELTVKMEDSPLTVFLGYAGAADRKLYGPLPNDLPARFESLIRRVASLSVDDLTALGAAANLHYGSILLFERDIRSAYLLLVAGLEVLSRTYGSPPHRWEDWEESRSWEKFFTEVKLTIEQQEAIKGRLLQNRHLRLKATFRKYASDELPDSFWDDPWEEWLYPVSLPKGSWEKAQLSEKRISDFLPKDRELLSSALSRTYDIRSGLVHRGEDLSIIDITLRHAVPVTASEPLPYAVLRAILVKLLEKELEKRSSIADIPDIKVSWNAS
jgi:hypothetical protein